MSLQPVSEYDLDKTKGMPNTDNSQSMFPNVATTINNFTPINNTNQIYHKVHDNKQNNSSLQ